MAERPDWLEEIRARDHRIGRSPAGVTMTQADADRRRLLAYADTLARHLEDKTDEYDTLRGEFEQQRETCADHSMELAKLQAEHEADDEDRGTGCCAKDGIDCVSCMTGRCHECSECVHYDDSARDDDGDTGYYDPDED